jgi:hypothetical protein
MWGVVIVILVAILWLLYRRTPCSNSICNLEWAHLNLELQSHFCDIAIYMQEYMVAPKAEIRMLFEQNRKRICDIMQRYYGEKDAKELLAHYANLQEGFCNYIDSGMLSEISKEEYTIALGNISDWYSKHILRAQEFAAQYSNLEKYILETNPIKKDTFRIQFRLLGAYTAQNISSQFNF